MKSAAKIFVTGTGTEIGKTSVSCAIARYWAQRGLKVGVMKPIASGGMRRKPSKSIESGEKGGLISEDAAALRAAARSKDPLSLINPVCFKHPLAPESAALLEHRTIDWKSVQTSFNLLKNQSERLLVEGVGGAAVPLDKNADVTDLIKKFKLPVIVVAHSALGTLNHTLLTLKYLKTRNISVLGIVLNCFDRRSLADRTNLQFFQRRKIPILAAFPADPRFVKNFDFAAAQISKNPLLKQVLC